MIELPVKNRMKIFPKCMQMQEKPMFSHTKSMLY